MKAYLTFIRRNFDEIHMLGIDNPENIDALKSIDIISGQPIICIIDKNSILAFYLLNELGELHQCFGNKDYLFETKIIFDLTIINLMKFHSIKNYLVTTFTTLSLNEVPLYKEELYKLENKIFYNLLHTEIEIENIKKHIIREIKKSNLKFEIKQRFIKKLGNIGQISRKFNRKKIDLNLSGYGIYISSIIK